MTMTGGCRCGAVRYELAGPPARVSVCHCRDCQRSAGAPIVSWAVMSVANLRITQGRPSTFNSSGESIRRFCGTCGTGLFYENATFLPGLVDVQTMTLDEPDACPPRAQVQTSERASWVHDLHRIEAFPRYPGMD